MKEENSNTYTGSAYDGSDWELYTEGNYIQKEREVNEELWNLVKISLLHQITQ